MRHSLYFLTALALSAQMSMAHADEMSEFQKAQTAAHAWLKQVDQGNYAKSWQKSAEPLKKATTAKQLQTAIGEARAPLGKLISRQPISAQYTRTLPDAATGEYVVVQYETRFANRAAVIETITPMRGPDGVWRVSGYYLK